jgi:hypothetical protein
MNEECAECGNPVPAAEWHPVTTRRDEDGEMEIYAFCSEGCRSSWQADVAGDDYRNNIFVFVKTLITR